MPVEVDEIRFKRHQPDNVVVAMQRLTRHGTGDGWINFLPELSEEEEARVPVRSMLGAWFSARGSAVAMATWTPAATGRRPGPAQIGLDHGTGPKALARLDDLGIGLPVGWVNRQDHAKNGIVAELPNGVAESLVIEWLITAATALRTVVEPGDNWVARVHRPAG